MLANRLARSKGWTLIPRGSRALLVALAVTLLAGGRARVVAAPVDLRVEPDSSQVDFHITNPLGDVTNPAGAPSGVVHADSVGSLALTGRVQVDLRQLVTGIGMRDRHVKSKSILDVETYPISEFKLTAVTPDTVPHGGNRTAPGVSVQHAVAHGTLQLHGVTHEVEVPVELAWERARLRVRGDFTILLADYGIPRPKRLFIEAGKSVDVRLDLYLVP